MAKPKLQPSRPPTPQPQKSHVVAQQWSGPLPPPAALEHFNVIIPNGAERIMSMIEREQAHRIEYEDDTLNAMQSDAKRGHWIGGVVCILAVGGAIFTTYIGAHPTISIALVGVPVLGMIKAFMPNRSQSSK